MKDPCRICGGKFRGNQCRWIFSSSGKRNLQVILSYVLGVAVTRDGKGEFLCSKCVFMLENVVNYDVIIGRLQGVCNLKVQKLLTEKDNLAQCISHIYNRNNPQPIKSNGEYLSTEKPSVTFNTGIPEEGTLEADSCSGSINPGKDVAAASSTASEGNKMKRCPSSETLRGHEQSGCPDPRRSGSGSPFKTSYLKPVHSRSQNIYFNLVQRTCSTPGSFHSRSSSLQSLYPSCAESCSLACSSSSLSVFGLKTKGAHGFDNFSELPARSSFISSPSVCDAIKLLKSVQCKPLLMLPESKIPVLLKYAQRRPASGCSYLYRKSHDTERINDWKFLQDLAEDFNDEYTPLKAESLAEKHKELSNLEAATRQLTGDLESTRMTIDTLKKRLEEADEDNKNLNRRLEERVNELALEKKNSLKRDKTIQGLSLVLKDKDKEIEELCHEIEDRDNALVKAREATHKAQIQKYQGAEEHQSLLTEKEAELAKLLSDHHTNTMENQKLQRALGRRVQELSDLNQTKEQLEKELEDMQELKNKGDKDVNDLRNQLKKLNGEMAEKEHALEQQYQALLSESKQKVQSQEITIKRLTSSLNEKDQLLQEYLNMAKDADQERNRSPDGRDAMLAKLRERLKEKEKALEQAIDEKFAAIEEKDNEIRQLQLSLREKERDLERLNNLLSHNEETINSFDSVIKEKDVELQHLVNSCKNLQRAKQELEDNLARALREKDAIISQLQQSLANKNKDLEEMANTLLNQTQSNVRDLTEQLRQRLKVTETMLAEAMKDKERLVSENQNAVEGLLSTVGSKDQLLKESAEHYNRTLAERNLEIQDLRRHLSEKKHEVSILEKHSSVITHEKYIETAELKVLLTEKDTIINKLLESGQERDKYLAELKMQEAPIPQMLELKQTIQILQEQLEDKEAELTQKKGDVNVAKIPIIKKSAVTLKKELAQKTDDLNKALKKENELQIEVAELHSLLADLENRYEAQAANIESLTKTLDVKDEIIRDLHTRLGKPPKHNRVELQTQRGVVTREGIQSPGIPQRESTIIGGNSQQEALPALQTVLSEYEALNKALKAEQQLYSSLVRTVKEPDSAQRIHNLQMELTAVQLLRQKLEEGIRSNEDLRKDLEKELQRTKRKEVTDAQTGLIDPREMETLKHQLEDAQRWNTSLQARLGKIQGRGGGVGGTHDTFKDQKIQTSPEKERNSKASPQGNRAEHQGNKSSGIKPPGRKESTSASPDSKKTELDQEDQNVVESELKETSCRMETIGKELKTAEKPPCKDEGNNQNMEMEIASLRALLTETGSASVIELRNELARLHNENTNLQSILKEMQSTEFKESCDDSGDGEIKKDLKKVVKRLKTELMDARKNIKLLKEQLELNSSMDSESSFNPDLIVSMAKEIDHLKKEHEASTKRRVIMEKMLKEMEAQQPRGIDERDQRRNSQETLQRQEARIYSTPGSTIGAKSRLPVPVKSSKAAGNNNTNNGANQNTEPDPQVEQLQSALQEKNKECRELQESLCTAEFTLTRQKMNKTEATQTTDPKLHQQFDQLQEGLQEKNELNRQLEGKLSGSETGLNIKRTSASTNTDLDFHQLQKALREKNHINKELLERLHRAESTIEDLTINKGVDNWNTDRDLHRQVGQLQKALKEKSKVNKQLEERLSEAESTFALELYQLQKDLQERTEINKELQERLHAAESTIECLNDNPIPDTHLHQMVDQLRKTLQEKNQFCERLKERLFTAESTTSHLNPNRAVNNENPDMDNLQQVDQLQKALQEKTQIIKQLQQRLHTAEPAVTHLNANRAVTKQSTNLDLQKQVDQLQKALQQKKQINQELQQRLGTAESIIAHQNSNHKMHEAGTFLEQDDKEVQVDLQDLGYETCGKSENEVAREENRSTDYDNQLKQHMNEASLPSLLKRDGQFFSMENLDTNSSTSYPSSPCLSSPKISMKSLQIYDDYGFTDDSVELKQQVMELKTKLENYQRVIHHLQSLLRRNSLSSDLLTIVSEPGQQTTVTLQEEHGDLEQDGQEMYSHKSLDLFSQDHSQNGSFPLGHDGEDKQMLKDEITSLKIEIDKEKASNKNLLEQLHQLQSKIRSASPARFDSLVQSQARELSHLRQKIKDSRSLGTLHHHQLEDLNKSFEELLQASDVDYYVGKAFRGQLDKSLLVLGKLEERLECGDGYSDNEDNTLLEFAERESFSFSLVSPESLKHEITYLRKQLDSERRQLQKQLKDLARHNQNLAQATEEQLDVLSQEVQEKNKVIQQLQLQVRNQSVELSTSHNSSDSEASDRYSRRILDSGSDTQHALQCRDGKYGQGRTSAENGGGSRRQSQTLLSTNTQILENKDGLAQQQRLQGLQRENSLLQEKLKNSEQLNETLRTEVDLHRSIINNREDAGEERGLSPKPLDRSSIEDRASTGLTESRNEPSGLLNTGTKVPYGLQVEETAQPPGIISASTGKATVLENGGGSRRQSQTLLSTNTQILENKDGLAQQQRLQGLQRENSLLQEKLKNSEQLNETLRTEVDLHRSIINNREDAGEERGLSPKPLDRSSREDRASTGLTESRNEPSGLLNTAPPCSYPRTTVSEDHAALGRLQAGLQAPASLQGLLVRGEPKCVPSAVHFFTLCSPAMQLPPNYSVGGPRSSGTLTGRPAGASQSTGVAGTKVPYGLQVEETAQPPGIISASSGKATVLENGGGSRRQSQTLLSTDTQILENKDGLAQQQRLQGLQRENSLLQEKLKNSEQLNETLRTEVDLHRSIINNREDAGEERGLSPKPLDRSSREDRASTGLTESRNEPSGLLNTAPPCSYPRTTVSEDHAALGRLQAGLQAPASLQGLLVRDLLAEHLQEIRSLRQRLEESIRTNDRLREQLERRLAEAEPDPENGGGSRRQSQTLLSTNTQILENKDGLAQQQRLQGLQRENSLLQEKLKNSEQLNETLRAEVDLHRSIINNREDAGEERGLSPKPLDRSSREDKASTGLTESRNEPSRLLNTAPPCSYPRTTVSEDHAALGRLQAGLQAPASLQGLLVRDLLAEHLQEIRSLRQRLEESIRTNDRLREQLERRLAEAEPDPENGGGSRRQSQTLLSTNTQILENKDGLAQQQRLQGLQRENSLLQEKLKNSEQLNETLRTEVDLHRSIINNREDAGEERGLSPKPLDRSSREDKASTGLTESRNEPSRLLNTAPPCSYPRTTVSEDHAALGRLQAGLQAPASLQGSLVRDLLAEHLQEIRSLRQRLEESIRTNDRLREQLERRLAEAEPDPG
ncbi:UNVERIFIED_CONTAM: hypothetical protein FKN15_054929 [Acipenser sinensis]